MRRAQAEACCHVSRERPRPYRADTAGTVVCQMSQALSHRAAQALLPHKHTRVLARHQTLTPPQQQRSCLHVYEIAGIGIAFFFFFFFPFPELTRDEVTHIQAHTVRRGTHSVRVPWALQTSRQVDGMTRTWLCRSCSLPQTDRPLRRLCASSFICTDLCRCMLSMCVCVCVCVCPYFFLREVDARVTLLKITSWPLSLRTANSHPPSCLIPDRPSSLLNPSPSFSFCLSLSLFLFLSLSFFASCLCHSLSLTLHESQAHSQWWPNKPGFSP